MKRFVISLGGSLIVPSNIDVAFLRAFRVLIVSFIKRGYAFVIVCGGGKVCRDYQAAARKITKVTGVDLDWVGISSTLLNAELVRSIFGKIAFSHAILNPEKRLLTDKKLVVAGGFEPGWSSDMDSVLFAEQFKADTIINLSNIDYVYDKDPNKDKNARPLERLSWQEFTKIFGRRWTPGLNSPFDPIAALKARQLKLKAVIMGSDLKNLKGYLDGKPFKGTIIE
ncbi:MAG: UMP kinase [Candidatus Woesearchaeota archaeon]